MDCSQLCERLRRLLGLSLYEASAYLALLRGALRPREVAEEAGIPVQRVYDVLSRLQRRGLAVKAGDEWHPVPPREALTREATRLEIEAKRRAEELRRLAEELDAGSAGEHMLVLRGLEASIAAALEALRRCRGPVYLTVYKAAEKAAEASTVLEPLLKALEPPRRTKILYYTGARVPREALEMVERLGLEARPAPEALLDMMVACDTVVIGVPWGGDVATVVVRSSVFAEGLRRRLEEAWSKEGYRISQADTGPRSPGTQL